LPQPSPLNEIDVTFEYIFNNKNKKFKFRVFFKSDLFFEWISEKYLKPMNQADIQMNFEDSSEIKLGNFFRVSIKLKHQVSLFFDKCRHYFSPKRIKILKKFHKH
jgi:hypothetical protein